MALFMMRRRRALLSTSPLAIPLFFALLVALLIGALPAASQHEATPSSAPPPPAGDGSITVQVLRAGTGDTPVAEKTAGISLALYALGADGTPGFADGETDENGAYRFEGISTDPAIVYLVGARFQEIPFGERHTFEPGEKDARVEIEVAAPTEEIAGVEVEELRARVDWMGDRVVVREILRVVNPGTRVILLPEADRTRSIVVRPLSPESSDFAPGATSIGAGLVFEDGAVRFSGPLYPGEQRIEYQYSLPVDGRSGSLPIELREDAARVVVVAGTTGIEARAEGLVESSNVSSDSGQPMAAWARAGLRAGESFEIALALPEGRFDPALVSIPRSDLWVEVDDTRLTATVDIQLSVGEGPPVSGTPEAPLLRVPIPKGAEMVGVAPEAEVLGLVPSAEGGFDVIGPISSGQTSLGFSFRMPTRPEGIDLGLRFPREVATLNVLIADTGLALDSGRLHRRRPFRSGTRNYLHREAFNVSPDEVVDLRITPLSGAGLPRAGAVGLAIAAAALGALFLIAPLRDPSRREEAEASPLVPLQAELEAVYAEIADLDHDFETGKLEPEDYQPIRDGLRGKAIDLLARQREMPAAPHESAMASAGGSATTSTDAASSATSDTSQSSEAQPTTGGFCPHCGGQVASQWRFCSHCGEGLAPAPESAG